MCELSISALSPSCMCLNVHHALDRCLVTRHWHNSTRCAKQPLNIDTHPAAVYFTVTLAGVAVLLGRVPEDARTGQMVATNNSSQCSPNAPAIPAGTGVAPSSTRGRSSAAAAEKCCLVAASGPCDVVAAGSEGGACIIWLESDRQQAHMSVSMTVIEWGTE